MDLNCMQGFYCAIGETIYFSIIIFENEDIHLNRQLAKTINFFKSLPEEPKPKTKIIRTPAGPKEVIDTGIQNKTQNFAGYTLLAH
jgi:hypothetical protein